MSTAPLFVNKRESTIFFFFVKDQRVSILGFVLHMFYVITTQLCLVKAAIDNL